MSEKERRRQWATDQITQLQAEIERYKAFLKLLDESDAALHGANGGTLASQKPRRRRKQVFADAIAEVLESVGPDGLTVSAVTAALSALGYHDKGKTKLLTAVGSELYRQVKLGRRGISKVGPGRYAIARPSQKERLQALTTQ